MRVQTLRMAELDYSGIITTCQLLSILVYDSIAVVAWLFRDAIMRMSLIYVK